MTLAEHTAVKTLTRADRNDPPLRYQIYAPSQAPRASVLLSHGLGEHRQRYAYAIKAWNDAGILVAAYDLRGHGSSGGARGHVDQFEDYVRDLIELLDTLEREDAAWRGLGKPALFGHSMGGLITLHTAIAHPGRARAVLLSSPYLGTKAHVPAIQAFAGRLLSRWVPTFSQPTGLKGKDAMRDPVLAQEYDVDPLNVKTVSVRWFTEIEKAHARALERASAWSPSLPLFVLASAEDRLVDVGATDRFMEGVVAKNKHYEKLPAYFHELFNDPERDRPIDAFAQAILGFFPSETLKAEGQR